MSPIVTYSLLALCVAALVFGYWVGDKRKQLWAAKLAKYATVIQLAAVACGYLVLRPGEGNDGSAIMQQAHAQGQPVFVDVYSNY